jgi:hypothetical protein
MSGLTASNLPVVCGVWVVTCTRIAQKRVMLHQYLHATTAVWQTKTYHHPSNYWGCSHTKEICKKKSQRAPNKTATGRMFSSNCTTSGQSAGALRNNMQQQQQSPSPGCTVMPRRSGRDAGLPPLLQHNQQETSQSVQAPNVSSSLNDMLKVPTVVQQIMIELSGTMSQDDKIVAITKIVL